MKIRKIAILSCCGEKIKSDKPLPAYKKYNSQLFNIKYQFCKKNFDKLFILSSKYGLLNPEDLIEDYNEHLKNKSKTDKRNWDNLTYLDLLKNINPEDEIHIHCGRLYRTPILKLKNRIISELNNLTIGKKLQWYSKRLKNQINLF